MRLLPACLAAVALALAGGCKTDNGSVLLMVEQPTGVSPPVTGYSSSDAVASPESTGLVHFTATSNQGTLTMEVQGPLVPGQNVDLGQEHNFLSFDVTGAGWASNGGMIAVDGVDPFRIRFLGVPMMRSTGAAAGSFAFTGSGTFK